MLELIFSPPWWISTTILLIGGVVLWSGNNSGQARVRNTGLAVLSLGLLLVTLGYLVETDKEKVVRQSRELVKAVPARDWVAMTNLMDPGATLGTLNATLFTDRKSVVDGAKAAAEHYGVKGVGVTGLQATQDPSGITVDLTVLVDADASTLSSWRFTWERDGKDWRVHQIQCLKINNESPESIGKLIGH